MSTMLKDRFYAFIKGTDETIICETLGCYPSHIKRWIAETHRPSWEHVSLFVERVLLKAVEGLYEKRIQAAVEAAVKDLVGDETPLTTERPVPTQAAPPPQAPAPAVKASVAAPEAQETTVFKGNPKSIKVPEGKEAEFSAKFAAWMTEHRKAIPEQVMLQLGDIFFPAGGRNLAVLFPCHKYTNPATTYALMALALDLGKEKMRFNSEFGDGLVYHARNKLAKWFLEQTDAEWSLWMDDDMIPPIGRPDWFKWVGNMRVDYPNEIAGRHVVNRLMSHQKTMVGACYFSRQLNGNAMYHEGKNNAEEDAKARRVPNEIRPTEWVGTGCLLVHRSVYLDIQKKQPELAPSGARNHWDFFLPLSNQGEDVAFCQRAKAAGHEVFVDLGLQPHHVGYACYGGHNTIMKTT